MMTLVVVGAALLVCMLGAVIGGWLVAYRLIHPAKNSEPFTIRSIHGDSTNIVIELDATSQTRAHGEYGIWFANDSGHASLGPMLEDRGDTITRPVESSSGPNLTPGAQFRWSGITQLHPSELNLKTDNIKLNDQKEAWHIQAEDPASTQWAVHIHGLGGKASSTLRTIPAFTKANFHSLTASYGTGHSTTLGFDEWREIDQMVSYAVRSGATSIVLVGWSMGAAIAKLIITHSAHAELVSGVLLISPVLDWHKTILHSARTQQIPTWIARAGIKIVRHPILCRTVGLAAPLPLTETSWLNDSKTNVLIMHSPTDRSTPFAVSQAFANESESQATLIPVQAGHTLEWNANPEACSKALTQWLDLLAHHQKPSESVE